jgi:hypothetical protein
MRHISYLLLFVFVAVTAFTSCDDGKTYAELLNEEKILIADYIKRNNIQVLKTFPTDNKWNDSMYVLTKSGLYFQLVNLGDTASKVQAELQDEIVPRYKAYTLSIEPDTISKWSTIEYPNPDVFVYGNYTQSCDAFHEAVSYMKYNDSEAKIIVRSKIGFRVDLDNATPKGYHLKIKIRK